MKQYVVDAFADKIFTGNPAAVCIMEQWLPDSTMQHIARENNLSETAFAVKEGEAYHLRWFTPSMEVDLCGHGTLATAYVITHFVEPQLNKVVFDTLSGQLTVQRDGNMLTINFPSYQLTPIAVTEKLSSALGITPVEAYMGADLVCVLANEDQVRQFVPDLEAIRSLKGPTLHITAPGTEFDCVTRSFAPKLNVPEDPVCGRGHCHVIPLWAAKTGKAQLIAYQASPRGGILHCRVEGDRTFLSGPAALFSIDELFLENA